MDIKCAVEDSLGSQLQELIDLSHRIHSYPELGFEEERACRWLGDLLSAKGFNVERGICQVSTAFAADFGPGPFNIVLCAEYDALPGIGHACGHNIIAAAAAGAALALAPVVDELGVKIRVLGTPAEEIGNASGKILLLERGGFDHAHAALMVHPAPWDSVRAKYDAASAFSVEYHGKASHASVAPELGINAGDALTIAQVGIGLLRQHMLPWERIHGIITKGGDAPNVIPDSTSARYIVRTKNLNDLEKLTSRVFACFQAGATASGCTFNITGGDKPYAEMRPDMEILALYKKNAESLGRRFVRPPASVSAGASSDMGNVSQQIPSIHPCIGIDSYPAVNHQPEFAAHCVRRGADKAVRDGALGLAWTIVDLATNQAARDRLISRSPAAQP